MRDERGRSARPRRLGELLGDFQEDIKPPTALAAIEMVWRGVVGDQIAEVTELVDADPKAAAYTPGAIL